MSQVKPLKDRLFYSQNREDLILEAFFPDVEKGFYVDVGANNPTKHSVTKLFYNQGWHGINIEPIKHHFISLKSERPRDINLNIGIGRKQAELAFHEYTGGDGLSTFSPAMAKGYAEQVDFPFKDSKEYIVAVQTLADVFAEQKATHIHFLKIDVEGFEYDVLAGNDWDVYRPEVICIEANHITEDWRPLLKQHNYTLAFFDGLNEYYVDAQTKRQSRFNYVDSVITRRGGGISNDDYETIEDLRAELQASNQHLQAALADAAEKAELHKKALADNHENYIRAAALEHTLHSPRGLAKHVARGLHGRVVRKLTPAAPSSDYTAEEHAARAADLQKLSNAKDDDQRLKAVQRIAASELDHQTSVYRSSDKNSVALRLYLRSVNTVKRVRAKRTKR